MNTSKYSKLNSIKVRDVITVLMTIFFFAYYFIRTFQYFIDEISWGIVMVVEFIYLIISMNWKENETKTISCFIFLIIFLTIFECILQNKFNVKELLSLFNMLNNCFFPIYLFYNLNKVSIKAKKFILFINIVVLCYVLVETFTQLEINDSFMRRFDINYLNYHEFNIGNAGGYQFAYSMVMLACFCPNLFYEKLSFTTKLFSVISFVVCCALVLSSSYSLALLITFIVVFLVLIRRINNLLRRVCVSIISFVIVLCIFIFSDYLVKLLPTETMRVRFNELFAFFKTGNLEGDNLIGRLNLYWNSVLAFLHSPFIGNASLSFDPHSSFFRFLAKDGIFGFTLYVVLHVMAYKTMYYMLPNKHRKALKYSFIALILMGCVNPIHSAAACYYMVFTLIPLILDILVKGENRNETTLGS